MNQNYIANIQTENVRVVWQETGDKTFEVKCNFIPDKIEVRASISPSISLAAVASIEPEYFVEDASNNVFYFSSNVFSVHSDIIGSMVDPIAVCGMCNTFNPISTYFNKQRINFSSTYTVNVRNVTTNNQLINGVLILTFIFTRYGDEKK